MKRKHRFYLDVLFSQPQTESAAMHALQLVLNSVDRDAKSIYSKKPNLYIDEWSIATTPDNGGLTDES